MVRGRGWTAPETLYMLGLVERILPFGSNQWSAVQLERKFYALKSTRKPTGDPSCPADVAQAKRVYRLIENQCGVLLLDDTESTTASAAAMEECNATRQLEYRRERYAQRRQDELGRQSQAERREERERLRLLALIAEIAKTRD
ncbi:uncharacterized protein PITG_00535 [Phytophthora infestans T30-4]|uniref:DUF6818 domain-containing protein n=1 Tax=Phytophthora infestans (strain T30-4) TaxID=403677 RepID=D0MR20_PHYIT|nr:uncharacterized protein PITG_00535 [Phytophthora infestans T30-4]EEY57939.1 hypothetical protein PITG_00535 [Phytophthora infestans T30-4]|eukprot:XP_002909125.1 hypothetical protein PITG_00535 [Phytophthora infestans T30-4]